MTDTLEHLKTLLTFVPVTFALLRLGERILGSQAGYGKYLVVRFSIASTLSRTVFYHWR